MIDVEMSNTQTIFAQPLVVIGRTCIKKSAPDYVKADMIYMLKSMQ